MKATKTAVFWRLFLLICGETISLKSVVIPLKTCWTTNLIVNEQLRLLFQENDIEIVTKITLQN